MAHAIVEYTDNLGPDADIPRLLKTIAAKLNDSGGVFPLGGIRVRAIRLTEYVIADGQDDYAFVNTTIKMGPGRPESFKTAFFGELFELIKAHFAEIYARRYLALSLYVEEADEAGSFKHNNIHQKFKAAAAAKLAGAS
jgi:5-carboxymethyl-2-hydroxymuconate isomerase